MKKIVGILAVASVLATSVFAADVAASTKIGGKLFNYSGDEKKVEVLTENNDSHDYANPNITFTIGDEKAGATVKLTTDGAGSAEYKNADGSQKVTENGAGLKVRMTTQTIWFKPIDQLKVTAGNFDIALNKEQIDWTESVTGLGGNGFLLSVNVSGFGLDLGLDCNGAYWLTKEDDKDDPAIKAFFIKGAYAADFGEIGAFVKFNNGFGGFDGSSFKSAIKPKDGAIKDTMFGASYKNTFDPITMFVNVVGYMDDKFEWIRPEVYVSGNIDAFGFQAFVAPAIMLDSDVKEFLDFLDVKPIFCEAVAKVTYKLDPVTVYAYFKDVNLLAKKFACQIKLGAQGNCGAMGWNAWAQIDTGKGAEKNKTDFSIPVEFTINF